MPNILTTCLCSTFPLNEWINNFPFFVISFWSYYCGWITKLWSLSILWESGESFNQHQFSQNFHTHWALDAALEKVRDNLDQGDDIHWAGNNKRYEANHLNFLGLTKIVRIENININNKSLSLLHNKESNFSE